MVWYLLSDSRPSPARSAFVPTYRPQVADDGERGRPGYGKQHALADRGSQKQAPHGLDHRRERLVLRERSERLGHRRGRDEAAAEERQEEQRQRQVAGAPHALGDHAERDAQPRDAEHDEGQQAGRGEPLGRPGRRPEADQEGDGDDDRDREHRLQDVADDVAGQDGRASDGHGPEPGDDPLGHVERHGDGGSSRTAGGGHQQDPGHEVSDVVGPAARRPNRPAEPGAKRAAEDEHEQQEEEDRDAGDIQNRQLAPHPPDVATQHRERVGQDVGEGHRGSSFWFGPVSARNTSSRSGMRTSSPPTSMAWASSRVRRSRSERALTSIATSKVRASSSRVAPSRACSARSSSAGSVNPSRMWPPGTRRFSCSGDPAATIRPWSSSAIWSARRSASSRYWVVSKIVTPSPTSPRTMSHMTRRLRGSRPAVGSSRKMIRGSPTSVIARSSRRRSPPE